jgi:hypothetical protein
MPPSIFIYRVAIVSSLDELIKLQINGPADSDKPYCKGNEIFDIL